MFVTRALRIGFCLSLTLSAGSAAASDCGTIIVPPGIGEGPGADVTSFNPLLVQSLYNQETTYLLFTQLIWINRYHKIDYSRSVASDVSTPDQGKTYNVTLRPWHWSDGVPVTATDVQYTFDLLKQLGDTSPEYGTGGMPDIVQSFNIVDPTHFTLILKHSVNPDWFILNGMASLVPMPEHIWGHYNLAQIWQNQSSPQFFSVGDGALKIQKLVVGQEAIFVPNPHYVGKIVNFSRFILRFIDSEGR